MSQVAHLQRVQVLGLYRKMMRSVALLPQESQPYYRDHGRSHFVQHNFENDPERIDALLERGERDIDWVLKKVIFCFALSLFSDDLVHKNNTRKDVITWK